MIHRDEKPHQCDLCERSFTQKGNLKRHFEAKHCINKDYKCNVCEKVFENKWSLNIHTATEHFHDIA
ncbi:PREDICTED: protein krueppel-like [Trachymyrmex cornetzi]|nr:PREDICTED: protein krueppel-like [Trachymyrmex cornetzi]